MLSKKKLKATNFFKPYTGKLCTLQSTGAGVYIIKKNNKIVYVGMSATDVKKTMYRHFQVWTDLRTGFTKKKEVYDRVTYTGEDRNLFLCKVIYTPTATEANILEQLLILKFKPADNTAKIYLFTQLQSSQMEVKLNDIQTISALNIDDPF